MRGHIRKRVGKRGTTWSAVVYMGRHPKTGRKWWKWMTFRTKGEAEAALTQLLTQVRGGIRMVPSKLSTGQFLERWLRDEVGVRDEDEDALDSVAGGASGREPEGRLEPSTRQIYKYDVRHYLKPRIGDIPLPRLGPYEVEACLADMRSKRVGRATEDQVFRVLRTALAAAVRWKLLPGNPAKEVRRQKGPAKQRPIWDEEETRLFLAEARRSSRYYRLYLAMLLMGTRPGETLALRWEDVDLDFARMTVRQKFYRLGRRQVWGEPKNDKENYLAMSDLLVAELRQLREEQAAARRVLGAAYQDQELVFCQANGKPLHAHNISQRDFRGVIKRAKVKRLRFYDLRHCHGTYFADLVKPHVLKDRMGHSSTELTYKYYVHQRPELQRQAANDLARMLLGRILKT